MRNPVTKQEKVMNDKLFVRFTRNNLYSIDKQVINCHYCNVRHTVNRRQYTIGTTVVEGVALCLQLYFLATFPL